MLQDLTPASFEAHQGTPFRIDLGGEAAPGAGAPAGAAPRAPSGRRARSRSRPTSWAREPRSCRSGSTGSLTIGMGTLDLFLVPLGPDPKAGGMLYEAVFN